MEWRRVIWRFKHGHESVITKDLPFLSLLCFDNADEPGGRHTAGKGRLIQENENIQRIPILTSRRGNEPKIERK
jgi:hypothetical protein